MFLRILLLVLVFFTTCINAFASLQAELSMDVVRPQLNKTFTLTLEISSDTQSAGEILSFDGLNNFSILSQRQSSSVKIIDQESQSSTIIQYVLSPNKTGDFSLGPVVLKTTQEEQIESNTLEFNVAIPTQNNNTEDELFPIENLKLTWSDFMYHPSVIFVVLMFLAAIIYLFINTKKEKIEEIITLSDDIELEDIKTRLAKLKQKINQCTKDDFYGEFNLLLRRYLEFKGYDNASKKTYQELQLEGINKDIMKVFYRSYISEFSKTPEHDGLREDLVQQLYQIIED